MFFRIIVKSQGEHMLTRSVGATFVAIGLSVAGCGGSSPAPAPTPTVTGLSLTPTTNFLLIGQAQTYTATAALSNGTSQTVTPAWSVDNTSVLNIDSTGRATALLNGQSTVIATYQGRVGSRLVRV